MDQECWAGRRAAADAPSDMGAGTPRGRVVPRARPRLEWGCAGVRHAPHSVHVWSRAGVVDGEALGVPPREGEGEAGGDDENLAQPMSCAQRCGEVNKYCRRSNAAIKWV